MKSILFASCIILVTNIVLGQGRHGGSELAKTHPDHPMKCWNEETKIAYSPGDRFVVKGSCREAICTKQEGDILVIFYEGCPLTRHQSDCKYVSKQPESEYPACCPELVC